MASPDTAEDRYVRALIDLYDVQRDAQLASATADVDRYLENLRTSTAQYRAEIHASAAQREAEHQQWLRTLTGEADPTSTQPTPSDASAMGTAPPGPGPAGPNPHAAEADFIETLADMSWSDYARQRQHLIRTNPGMPGA